MSALKGKIDFTLFISVLNANPNGDPLNGNRPRMNMDGYGEISDVCIKRKIRNRFQDLGQSPGIAEDVRQPQIFALIVKFFPEEIFSHQNLADDGFAGSDVAVAL